MKIGVAGLGLIGGSLAKAFKNLPDTEVLGYDIDSVTLMRAKLVDATHGELTKKNIKECDYVFIALYPKAATAFLAEFSPLFKKDAVIVDCAGTKKTVCEMGFKKA